MTQKSDPNAATALSDAELLSKIHEGEELALAFARKLTLAGHALTDDEFAELLKHFGGLQGVMRAGVADFEQVPGIGASLARSLYDHLHPGD